MMRMPKWRANMWWCISMLAAVLFALVVSHLVLYHTVLSVGHLSLTETGFIIRYEAGRRTIYQQVCGPGEGVLREKDND
jgi:hypothetical protein